MAARHARGFLTIGDPDASSLDAFAAALGRAARSRNEWPALQRVERWTRTQLGVLGVAPERAMESDDVLDVLAAVGLVAARAPTQGRRPSQRQLLHRLAAILDGLEPDFVPELLKETRHRMADEAEFSAQIADSRRAVTKLSRSAQARGRELATTIPPELEEDPELPSVLRSQEDEAGVFIGVFVVVLVLVVVAWWIAGEDPGKD